MLSYIVQPLCDTDDSAQRSNAFEMITSSGISFIIYTLQKLIICTPLMNFRQYIHYKAIHFNQILCKILLWQIRCYWANAHKNWQMCSLTWIIDCKQIKILSIFSSHGQVLLPQPGPFQLKNHFFWGGRFKASFLNVRIKKPRTKIV